MMTHPKVWEIVRVEPLHPGHFYWPDLDVDLSIEVIEYPGCFPRISQN